MSANFSDTTPSAPTGKVNVQWQSDAASNISANITDFSNAVNITSGTINAARLPAIAESAVTNLVSDLAAKAPLNSPALTGTPTAPTATTSDNSTQIATTAFVKAQGYGTGSLSKYSTSWTAQTSVTVTHSLGTTDVIAQVFDGSGALAFPESLTITDANTITLAFGASFTGSITVIG